VSFKDESACIASKVNSLKSSSKKRCNGQHKPQKGKKKGTAGGEKGIMTRCECLLLPNRGKAFEDSWLGERRDVSSRRKLRPKKTPKRKSKAKEERDSKGHEAEK